MRSVGEALQSSSKGVANEAAQESNVSSRLTVFLTLVDVHTNTKGMARWRESNELLAASFWVPQRQPPAGC